MSEPPGIAVTPFVEDGLVAAVGHGGGRLVEPSEADAIVWTNPGDPHGLRAVVGGSAARWVQLPFAGIEEFADAGVLDTERVWTCTKGAYGRACAEHALGLMLAAARQLHVHVAARSWRPGGLGSPERRLEGVTCAIVGTGGIGSALAAMLEPLAMRVFGVNRSGRPLRGAAETHSVDRLREVLPRADFVVLAAALTAETRGLFDGPMLARMKPNAWLVNVARGAMVDTDALVDALRSGRIGGAALDVTDPEPLPDGHPLWDLPNVIVTPHVANTWDMALPELRGVVERNVARFAAGETLEGIVDVSLGY